MFDEDGRHIGTTVTREPEWDDAQRDAMTALKIYEAGVCGGCGFHHSIADDMEHNHVAIEENVCEICKAAVEYGRIQDERDGKQLRVLGENAPPDSPRPGDGRHTTMRLLSPLEVEARGESS